MIVIDSLNENVMKRSCRILNYLQYIVLTGQRQPDSSSSQGGQFSAAIPKGTCHIHVRLATSVSCLMGNNVMSITEERNRLDATFK